ncbi:hypothetical protein I3760_03G225800 [Carya illinoinensis]|nr:hypothetical protein I3760_03G225800 [Carya illinoinensis]
MMISLYLELREGLSLYSFSLPSHHFYVKPRYIWMRHSVCVVKVEKMYTSTHDTSPLTYHVSSCPNNAPPLYMSLMLVQKIFCTCSHIFVQQSCYSSHHNYS